MPTNSSRQSARPIATRSEISRGLPVRSPAATTGADRSASNIRAIARRVGGRRERRSPPDAAEVRPRVSAIAATVPLRPDPCIGAHGLRGFGRCDGTLLPMPQSPSPSPFALVFPGQGSQAVGMAASLVAASPAAARVFAIADEALAEPISRLAFEGPDDELNRTENAQPALLAASIAYLEAVRERWYQLDVDAHAAFAAGHSMGQYSALVAAGALDLEDALRLVRIRGERMQASGSGREGRMAAIIGLDDEHLPELVERASANGVFGVANRNSPGQVVVSGERAAVEASLAIAKEL